MKETDRSIYFKLSEEDFKFINQCRKKTQMTYKDFFRFLVYSKYGKPKTDYRKIREELDEIYNSRTHISDYVVSIKEREK